MAAVVSVNKYTFTLGTTDTSDTVSISGDITSTANCIVWMTNRITTGGSTFDFPQMRFDCYFSGTNLIVERDAATDMAAVCEVNVVEFDGSDIVVQQGTYSMGTDVITVDVTSGVTAGTGTTWLTHSFQATSTGGNFYGSNVMGTISATDTLTFDRELGAPGTIAGHWYTARDTTGSYWDVTQLQIDLNGVASNADTVSVTAGKTFLMGSFAEGSGNDNDDSTGDVTLDSGGTTVTVQRITTSGLFRWGGAAIEFQGNESVYRGTITAQGATASEAKSFSPDSVTQANSTVHTAGNNGGQNHGSFNKIAGKNVTESMCTWEFTADDEVTCKHLVQATGPADDNDISFEVIEWDLGGAPAPARRVMVIS